MTLRWISLVPPAMDRARLPRKPPVQAAPSPSAAAAGRAEQVEPDLLHVLLVLDAEQLADARLRARAGRRRAPAAWCGSPSMAMAWASTSSPPSRSTTSASSSRSCVLGQVEQRRRRPGRTTSPDAIDTRSLASVVRAASHPAVGRADDAVVGHEHVGEEDLVEHRHAGQLAQRPDVDARASSCRPGSSRCRRASARRDRCGRGRCAQSASWAIVVHTFWPVIDQPPSTFVGPRRERRPGRCPALGLAEHLAPA